MKKGTKKPRYSKDFIAKVMTEHFKDGVSISELVKAHGISQPTLCKWKKKHSKAIIPAVAKPKVKTVKEAKAIKTTATPSNTIASITNATRPKTIEPAPFKSKWMDWKPSDDTNTDCTRDIILSDISANRTVLADLIAKEIFQVEMKLNSLKEIARAISLLKI